MKNIISRITDFLNLFSILGLLTSYLSPHINPGNFWPVAFFGLTYPFWVLFNILLVFLWAKRRKARVFYNIIALAVGYPFFERNFQFNNEDSKTQTVKVVSFNTHVQNVYTKGNTTSKIENYLVKNDVDVAVLIEWLNAKGKISKTSFKHQEFKKLSASRNLHQYGLNVVSKYPILNSQLIQYDQFSNNMSAFYDIEINDEIIRFVVVHLQSNGLTQNDFKKVIDQGDDYSYKEHARNVVSKLKSSFIKRSSQVKSIRKVIDESPYPVVVLGDFNDTPQSYAYQKLRGNLKDAFIEKGAGIGSTFTKPFGLLRIDYILHSSKLKCTSFKTNSSIPSDHKLLETTFVF